MLYAAVTIALFLFAANSQAIAQKYKVGELVEVDPSGIKDWMKGTVLPFLEKEEPTLTAVIVEELKIA